MIFAAFKKKNQIFAGENQISASQIGYRWLVSRSPINDLDISTIIHV